MESLIKQNAERVAALASRFESLHEEGGFAAIAEQVIEEEAVLVSIIRDVAGLDKDQINYDAAGMAGLGIGRAGLARVQVNLDLDYRLRPALH